MGTEYRGTRPGRTTALLAIALAAALSSGCFLTDACSAVSQEENRKLQEESDYRNQELQRQSAPAPQPDAGADAGAGGSSAAKPVMDVGNPKAVQNGGTSPEWTAAQSMKVTEIATYHWNDGKGQTPGTIALAGSDGKTYGPWQTTGLPGQGGVPNATWVAKPNEVVPPGSYKVVDSDPGSWSQNADSGGQGFTKILASPAK